jgi:hypothetical protein
VAGREATLAKETPSVASGEALDAFTVTFSETVDLTPLPAVVERTDGATVLYAGKLNWVFGWPGGGKSWLALIACHFAVLRGGRAMYWDFEDTPATFQRRAVLIGFNPALYADSFRYVTPGLANAPAAVQEAQAWLADAMDPQQSLVAIDAAESSGCPSDGADVNPWLADMVTPWRDAGAGVTVVDHYPKNARDNPSRGPIGSGRKLAAVDGAALLVKGLPWTKSRDGRIQLINHKDRPSDLAAPPPKTIAVIEGSWRDGGFSYSIQPSKAQDDSEDMPDAILDAVAQEGGQVASVRKLIELVPGKQNDKHRAISSLVADGLLSKERVSKSDVFTLTPEGAARLSLDD